MSEAKLSKDCRLVDDKLTAEQRTRVHDYLKDMGYARADSIPAFVWLDAAWHIIKQDAASSAGAV